MIFITRRRSLTVKGPYTAAYMPRQSRVIYSRTCQFRHLLLHQGVRSGVVVVARPQDAQLPVIQNGPYTRRLLLAVGDAVVRAARLRI